MSDSQIVVAGVNKVFATGGREVVALKDIDLAIPAGQFVCLLGPSGCGKSTLLNAIAGFAPPSSGTIVAEMIAVSNGLGFRIMEAREYFWSDKIIAGMITIGLLGLAIDLGMSRLNNYMLRWHRGLES